MGIRKNLRGTYDFCLCNTSRLEYSQQEDVAYGDYLHPTGGGKYGYEDEMDRLNTLSWAYGSSIDGGGMGGDGAWFGIAVCSSDPTSDAAVYVSIWRFAYMRLV